MEETQDSIELVTIQPKIVFGLNTNVIGNIHFNNKQEIIYPVESVLAFQDYVSNKQKFLRLPEHTIPKIITVSSNKKLIAIVEQSNHDNKVFNSIVVYDLTTYKKRRSISSNDIKNTEITVISFTADSKGLAALSKSPEERLFLFLFDKMNTIMQGHIGVNNQRVTVECIACNPNDSGLIAVAGRNIFKMMTREERGFSTQGGNFKCDGIHIVSMAWLSSITMVAGTNSGNLLFIENGDFKAKFNAFNCEMIDLTVNLEHEDIIEQSVTLESVKIQNIVCMTSFIRGFAYAIFNEVYVFEKESKFKFIRRTILQIKPEPLDKFLYQIKNIAINCSQDTIIATAKHSQIYIGTLFPMETLKTRIIEFVPLGEILHTDEIIDLAVCSWRPIVMTASKDKTIRIWNYETGKIELIKRYEVDIETIELHQTGFLAAIAFSGQLKIMKIYFDDLNVVKTFNFPHCGSVKFSTQGHLIATAYENLIRITMVFNFDTVKTLKGHFAHVLNIAWSKNDRFLASGGVDGAVYLWDIETGTRIQEFVNKGVQYPAVALIQDNITIYSITSLGSFREIVNSEIVREIKPDPMQPSLLSMALSRSEQILFISSDKGQIFSIQLPFMETGGGRITNYRYFQNAVTSMKITYDDTLLITASKTGTLCFWIIKNIKGKIATMDRNLLKSAEVLTPREIIIDKNKIIENLKLRMEQQRDEHKHEIIEIEKTTNKRITEIHAIFQQKFDEQKIQFEQMLMRKTDDLIAKQFEIDQLQQKYEKECKNWEEKFSERVLIEYEKYKALEESNAEKCNEYDEKLRKSNEYLQETIESLEKKFENDIRKKDELIKKLQREKEEGKIEFIEYCRQVEVDNDRCLIELQKKYELKLKHEKDSVTKWRGEAKILMKKYKSASDNVEKLNKEVEESREQHLKYQKEIENQLELINSIKKQLDEKDLIILNKDKQIKDIQNKNNDLKLLINRQNTKIIELQENQIKPLEQKLNERRNHFAEIKCNFEKLEIKNSSLTRELIDSKGKYTGYKNDAILTRQRIQNLEKHLSYIYNDIYVLTRNINNTKVLKDGIRKMYEKYIENKRKDLQTCSLQNVENEFIRQRGYLENMIIRIKRDSRKKCNDLIIKRLIQEKNDLVIELLDMRKKLDEIMMGEKKKL